MVVWLVTDSTASSELISWISEQVIKPVINLNALAIPLLVLTSTTTTAIVIVIIIITAIVPPSYSQVSLGAIPTEYTKSCAVERPSLKVSTTNSGVG